MANAEIADLLAKSNGREGNSLRLPVPVPPSDFAEDIILRTLIEIGSIQIKLPCNFEL